MNSIKILLYRHSRREEYLMQKNLTLTNLEVRLRLILKEPLL